MQDYKVCDMKMDKENKNFGYMLGRVSAIMEYGLQSADDKFVMLNKDKITLNPSLYVMPYLKEFTKIHDSFKDIDKEFMEITNDKDFVEEMLHSDKFSKPLSQDDAGEFWIGYYQESSELVRNSIGKKIEYLRNEKAWTQEELSEKAGISREHLSRIESGRYSVKIDIIDRISLALGCRVDIVKI